MCSTFKAEEPRPLIGRQATSKLKMSSQPPPHSPAPFAKKKKADDGSDKAFDIS